MLYPILLQKRANGTFEASVSAFPGLKKAGRSRKITLLAMQEAIAKMLASTEIVYVEVPDAPTIHNNPWLATAGMMADDPTLMPMLDEIYVTRDRE